MAVFFTHRGFYGHHVIASIVLGRPPLSVVSVKVPAFTDYTAQRRPSSRSSTPAFINILLVSLGARQFNPPRLLLPLSEEIICCLRCQRLQFCL